MESGLTTHQLSEELDQQRGSRQHHNRFIEPGSPWQNGFAEFFNSRFRDEFLNTELFATVAEAQGLANRWRWEYNNFRPQPPTLIAPGPMKGVTATAVINTD